MDDLKSYVERLFAGHKKTGDVEELKAEILSNLEARIADHVAEGLPYDEALARAKRSLENVEDLLPDRKMVYVNRRRVELLQAALLYSLIAFVLTVPLRLISYRGFAANVVLFIAVIVLGIAYLLLSSRKEEAYLNAVAALNGQKLRRYSKAAWLLWTLYVVVMTAFNTAMHFGSDIWFGRSAHIDGPYQFAVLAAAYALPFITIILPLLFTKAHALAEKHEVEN